ncbi:hypothetical protein DFJ77DRAFT_551717 [Powellomyces hirtus]|nr:hypothetical protein DFJ77DRAFT_551717 [Powellomyces hirtus]
MPPTDPTASQARSSLASPPTTATPTQSAEIKRILRLHASRSTPSLFSNPAGHETAHQILQQPCTATPAQLTSAFRAKSLLVHPDRCGGDRDATAAFTALATAYDDARNYVPTGPAFPSHPPPPFSSGSSRSCSATNNSSSMFDTTTNAPAESSDDLFFRVFSTHVPRFSTRVARAAMKAAMAEDHVAFLAQLARDKSHDRQRRAAAADRLHRAELAAERDRRRRERIVQRFHSLDGLFEQQFEQQQNGPPKKCTTTTTTTADTFATTTPPPAPFVRSRSDTDAAIARSLSAAAERDFDAALLARSRSAQVDSENVAWRKEAATFLSSSSSSPKSHTSTKSKTEINSEAAQGHASDTEKETTTAAHTRDQKARKERRKTRHRKKATRQMEQDYASIVLPQLASLGL